MKDDVHKSAPEMPKHLEQVSTEAKMVASAWFSMMGHGPKVRGAIFHMQEYRASDWAQAALDELISLGFVEKYEFNKHGSIGYRPLIDFSACFHWITWAIEFSDLDQEPFKRPLFQPIGKPDQYEAEDAAH